MGFFNIFGKKEQMPSTAPDANTASGAPAEVMAPADVQVQDQVVAAEHGQGEMPEMSPEQKAALDLMTAPERPADTGSNSGQ